MEVAYGLDYKMPTYYLLVFKLDNSKGNQSLKYKMEAYYDLNIHDALIDIYKFK